MYIGSFLMRSSLLDFNNFKNFLLLEITYLQFLIIQVQHNMSSSNGEFTECMTDLIKLSAIHENAELGKQEILSLSPVAQFSALIVILT